MTVPNSHIFNDTIRAEENSKIAWEKEWGPVYPQKPSRLNRPRSEWAQEEFVPPGERQFGGTKLSTALLSGVQEDRERKAKLVEVQRQLKSALAQVESDLQHTTKKLDQTRKAAK